MNRKRIGLLTIFPEAEYQQRILPGILSQAEKYDYDVVVFTPLVQICNINKRYVHGELNIFELINFSLFDGFIITPVPMTEEQNFHLYDLLLKKFESECKQPVVSIDMEFGNYPVVYTDEENPFFDITEHLILKHRCKNISVLAGPEGFVQNKNRIKGIKKALKKHELELKPEQIYLGNFWYDSGEQLAQRYVTGELSLPDAVICLSDHMAIGLTNCLLKNGIKVPEQVIVTGYEAVQESSLNNPPITSYLGTQEYTGKHAVNVLHQLISPKAKMGYIKKSNANNLRIGSTCGCNEDIDYIRERLKLNQINLKFDYSDLSEKKKTSIGMLLESYMVERLAESISPADVLGRIYETKYLIRPFEHFYICLNDKWLDRNFDVSYGYSERMLLALSADRDPAVHGIRNHVFIGKNREKSFNRNQLLPALYENYDEPQVYYFVPVHFGTRSLGYAVLQNNLAAPGSIDTVFRNYMRNVNNALEMSRTKYQIGYLSEHDTMTGLYNRRGMERMILELEAKSSDSDNWFVIVIDMDGLKVLNDTHGHIAGDNGIIAVSEAASSITDDGEICVRGGGDEFFVIGLGDYDDIKLREKVDRFYYYIETKNETLNIPITASIGYAMASKKDTSSYLEILNKADDVMYKVKAERKKTKI